jgi:hypothetical protein
MRLYWKTTRRGLDLVVLTDEGDEFVVGGVRETKRGIEAMAKTMRYDPGRATRGLGSQDEGQAFVEQFQPWLEFFPAAGALVIEPDVVQSPLAAE